MVLLLRGLASGSLPPGLALAVRSCLVAAFDVGRGAPTPRAGCAAILRTLCQRRAYTAAENSEQSDFCQTPEDGEEGAAFQIKHGNTTFQAGRLAKHTDGACTVRMGMTQVLATVATDKNAAWAQKADEPPVQVEYRERLSAVGRIPYTHNRKDGGQSDVERCTRHAIIRAVSALFPRSFPECIQVTATVQSSGRDYPTDVVAINAVSMALALSDVPWWGPLAAVRVCVDSQERIQVHPTLDELQASSMQLLLVGSFGRVVALDLEAQEAPRRRVEAALRSGMRQISSLVHAQLSLAKRCGSAKRTVTLGTLAPAPMALLEGLVQPPLALLLQRQLWRVPAELDKALEDVQDRVRRSLELQGLLRGNFARNMGFAMLSYSDLARGFDHLVACYLRRHHLQTGRRLDGRGALDLRPMACQVTPLPRVHASAFLEQGAHQVMSTGCVGAPRDAAVVESMAGRSTKSFLLHHSLPAFQHKGWRERLEQQQLEVVEGQLAERALQGALSLDESGTVGGFCLRIHCDTLSQDGATAAAAASAGSLALAASGLQPSAPLVGGVGVGVVLADGAALREPEAAGFGGWGAGEAPFASARGEAVAARDVNLLVDYTDLEADACDALLQLARSPAGVNALSLETRWGGVPPTVFLAALHAGFDAAEQVVKKMEAALDRRQGARSGCIGRITVNQENIGRIVGPLGATVRSLEDRLGVRVTVWELKGEIGVWAPSQSALSCALDAIADMDGASLLPGSKHMVKVVSVIDYGAFVQFDNGVEALLHISELSHNKVKSVAEELSPGDTVEIQVLGRDIRGRLTISRKALQDA